VQAGVEHYDGSGDMMLAELYRGKIQSLFTKPQVIQEYMMLSMTKAANCQQEQPPAKKEKIEMLATPLPPQTPPSTSTFCKIELIKVVKQSPPSQQPQVLSQEVASSTLSNVEPFNNTSGGSQNTSLELTAVLLAPENPKPKQTKAQMFRELLKPAKVKRVSSIGFISPVVTVLH